MVNISVFSYWDLTTAVFSNCENPNFKKSDHCINIEASPFCPPVLDSDMFEDAPILGITKFKEQICVQK